MAGAFRKEVVRSITHSLGRFLAIAIIAALGCGFYAGLRLTGPDMRLAGDTYYDATNLCDLRVVSSLGFTDDQIDEISQVEGVSGVMPAYESDVIAQIDGVQYTTRIHSLNVDKARASKCDDGLNVESEDPNYINRPILVEGSWPESNDECLLSADTVWSTEVSVGDKVLLAEGTSDLDDTFAVHEYTVSGFVRSSYYTCSTSVGSTSLGSGQLATFAYVPEGAFAEDFPYTEAFVTVAGAREARWATDDYQSLVDATASRINGISDDLLASRLDGIRADAQAELDESRADFEAERADALQKLAPTRRRNLTMRRRTSTPPPRNLRARRRPSTRALASLRAGRLRLIAGGRNLKLSAQLPRISSRLLRPSSMPPRQATMRPWPSGLCSPSSSRRRRRRARTT